jgi:hypothetical protein
MQIEIEAWHAKNGYASAEEALAEFSELDDTLSCHLLRGLYG